MSILGVVGLFLVLLASAGDEAVWAYLWPPIALAVVIFAAFLVLMHWREAMRGLRG